MDLQKATARRDDNHFSFVIWYVLYDSSTVLTQGMAWYWLGNKSLPEPNMVKIPNAICQNYGTKRQVLDVYTYVQKNLEKKHLQNLTL